MEASTFVSNRRKRRTLSSPASSCACPPLLSLLQLSSRYCNTRADMITREEAESVLSKAPSPSYLRSTIIHRLPSLATLGGAFWAGQSLTTELLATSTLLTGVSTTLVATAPVAVGCLAVGGAMLLFSRSARARGSDVAVGVAEGEEGMERMEIMLWRGARRVEVESIRPLGECELRRELFPPPPLSILAGR